MKKTLLAILILFAANSVEAGWNFNFFGSNDKQKKSRHKVVETINPIEPIKPVTVVPTPEPGTFFLVGAGLLGLAAMGRKR